MSIHKLEWHPAFWGPTILRIPAIFCHFFTKIWVSRAFRPVLDTVFDVESDFSYQNRLNLQENSNF